jgi:hypothetical protein
VTENRPPAMRGLARVTFRANTGDDPYWARAGLDRQGNLPAPSRQAGTMSYPQVPAVPVQAGDLAGDRAGDLMQPAKLRGTAQAGHLRPRGRSHAGSAPSASSPWRTSRRPSRVSTRRRPDRITAAAVQHVEAARQSASILITEAGTWPAEQLRETAAEISASLLKELRQEVTKAEAAACLSVRVAWLTGGIQRRRPRRAALVSGDGGPCAAGRACLSP